MSSPPGFARSFATIAFDRSIPCTCTPRRASGSAIRPVPIPNSSARPLAREIGEEVDGLVDDLGVELLADGLVVRRGDRVRRSSRRRARPEATSLHSPRERGEHLGIREVLRIPRIRAAMLGTFVVMLGFGILSPVLPNYARSFGVGYDAVGLLISAFSFARLVADPFVGRFIDRYGERAMSTVGAVWVGISSIAAGLASTFPLLVIFRAVGGVGSALFFAALLSFLLRSIPAERTGRVMGVYYAAFNVGFIAGGPLGGLIARWFGLASPLYVYAAACLIAAVVFWKTLHDPERHESETRRGGIRRLPWNRPFITVLVVNGVYLWIIGAVFQTLVPLFGTSTSIGLTITGVGFALGVATATEPSPSIPRARRTTGVAVARC